LTTIRPIAALPVSPTFCQVLPPSVDLYTPLPK
jgi:hypothetical protein